MAPSILSGKMYLPLLSIDGIGKIERVKSMNICYDKCKHAMLVDVLTWLVDQE